jgi:hypothetical protein
MAIKRMVKYFFYIKQVWTQKCAECKLFTPVYYYFFMNQINHMICRKFKLQWNEVEQQMKKDGIS